jgi:hypothetical protein
MTLSDLQFPYMTTSMIWELGVVAQTRNPSTQEAEAGGWGL